MLEAQPLFESTPPTLGPHHRVLADLIKALRLEAGLTQTELATKLGVSQSLISKVESGELQVDLIQARALANALGISMASFVERWEQRLSEKNDAG